MPPVSIVFDFDGTLATTFVGGLMFKGYVSERKLAKARERFLSEETSLREYQEEVFDMIDDSPEGMSRRAVSEGSIRKLALEVCERVWESGGNVAVASAGLDVYIRPVLDSAKLGRIAVHSGTITSDRTLPAPFRYDYPSAGKSCRGDWVTCKCEVINKLRKSEGEEVIFVGDGVGSDECAATNAADTVFATGRLLNYCNENDISVTEFGDDFGSVLGYVISKTSANGVQ